MLDSKGNPLVTVITPNWNGAAFLEQTILSVLNQTYGRIEYIVIDGGSTDDSLKIINRYEDSISYWVSAPDKGMYQAINKGVALASGDIIAYLNSDDLYFPETISKVVNYFVNNPSADLVYGNLDHIDENGTRVYTKIYPKFNWKRFARANYAMIGQPAAFWRRNVFDQVGLFDESMKMAADFEFFIRVGRVGNLVHVPDILAAFRLHSGSLTCGQTKLGKEEVCRIHAQYFSEGTFFWGKIISYWSDICYKLLNWKAMMIKLGTTVRKLLNV